MSGLPWLWFDLVPAEGNLPPMFDVPLAQNYSAVVGEPVTFSVTVSDPDGDPLIVNWSFGDSGDTVSDYLSSGTSVPTTVVQTHTYLSVAAGLELRVTVDDSQGPPVQCLAHVDVTDGSGERGVQYRWHGMFEEPFGDWWDHRWNYQIVSDSYPYIYGKYVDYGGIGAYYSSMQLDLDAYNLPEVNMNANPEFLPQLGTERGGTAAIDWCLQYITYEEAAATSPLLAAYYDGWISRLSGMVALDATAAKGVMGVTDGDLEDFDTWWAANEMSFTTAYESWLIEDAERLGTFSMYDWPLQIMIMNMDAFKENDTVVLSYDLVSWGMEALMTKWLHEAFMPTEWYFEDFSMHAVISPETADIQVDTAVTGAVFGWKDISTDELSWVWRGMLQDYIPSYETLGQQPSDFDPYEELSYMNMYAGSQWYGYMVPFEYTPGAFNLSEGEELSFEWPGGPQTFIVADHDYVTAEYEMTVPYSEPSPADLPAGVSVDTALRTLKFEGPIDMYSWSREQTAHSYLASEWDRLGVLPYGMPWIEFRASVGAPEPFMLVLENIPYEVATEQPVNITLKVVDHNDQVCEDYRGTVYFQSSDPYAVLPEPYTFTAEDAGVHVFEVRFMTAGDQWLGIEDIVNTSLSVGIWFNVVQTTAPVASMMYLPLMPSPGEIVTFFAYGSYDESGIAQYLWSFGDGVYASGYEVWHVYAEPGTYHVTLTVVNTYGVDASAYAAVEVGKIGSGVKGTVVSENSKPLKNAEVAVLLNGFVVASARTNGDGAFSVRGLIPGTYDLVVSKKGYADTTMSITVGEGVLDVGTIVLTRDRGTIIEAMTAQESALPPLDISAMLGLVLLGGLTACGKRR